MAGLPRKVPIIMRIWQPKKKQPCHSNGYLQTAADVHRHRNRFLRNPLAKLFVPPLLRMSPGYPCCCCEEKVLVVCNYCTDGQSPAQWMVTIAGATIVEDGNVTLDINGSHRLEPVTVCDWRDNLPLCGGASCTAFVPLRLSMTDSYDIIVQYGEAIPGGTSEPFGTFCNYECTWRKHFSQEELVDGKIDCLSLSGLELTEISSQGIPTGATCHVSAHPYELPPYDYYQCDDKINYYVPLCRLPLVAPGPPAIEVNIDGTSYTLMRTGYECPGEDYDMGYDPSWLYYENIDPTGRIGCIGVEPIPLGTGLCLGIVPRGQYCYSIWGTYICWEDESHTSTTRSEYNFQFGIAPENFFSPPCLGLCNLNATGEVTVESVNNGCRQQGAPQWLNAPVTLRGIA